MTDNVIEATKLWEWSVRALLGLLSVATIALTTAVLSHENDLRVIHSNRFTNIDGAELRRDVAELIVEHAREPGHASMVERQSGHEESVDVRLENIEQQLRLIQETLNSMRGNRQP